MRVITGRHPFEVLFLVAAILVSLAYLTGLGHSHTASAVLPDAFMFVWYLTLLAGGAVSLVDVALTSKTSVTRVFTGLQIEGIGMCLMAPSILTYCATIVVVSGTAGAGSAALTGAFGVSAAYRIWQIQRDIHHAKQKR